MSTAEMLDSTARAIVAECGAIAEMLDSTARAIVAECGAIADLLVAKNRRYGNSALEPVRLFSRADAIEQIKVRIDDKLSRIKSGQADDTEDAELDLLGYLVLLRIARRHAVPALNSAGAVAAGYVVPPVQDGDDDPVVHIVPDRSSRATLPDVCLGALCGRRSSEYLAAQLRGNTDGY